MGGPGQGSVHVDLAKRWLVAVLCRIWATGLPARLKEKGHRVPLEPCCAVAFAAFQIHEDFRPTKTLLKSIPALTWQRMLCTRGRAKISISLEYGAFTQSKMHANHVMQDCHNPQSDEMKFEGKQSCNAGHEPAQTRLNRATGRTIISPFDSEGDWRSASMPQTSRTYMMIGRGGITASGCRGPICRVRAGDLNASTIVTRSEHDRTGNPRTENERRSGRRIAIKNGTGRAAERAESIGGPALQARATEKRRARRSGVWSLVCHDFDRIDRAGDGNRSVGRLSSTRVLLVRRDARVTAIHSYA